MTECNTTAIPRITRELVIMQRLALDGAHVVDIGCGEGWLTKLVAPRVSSIIGVDPSVTALERASAENNPVNASYLLASADNLPLDPASADIVIYFNSLHHVPAALQAQALGETARVLADDGILCIVEPVASGSAYELFRPVDDESDVYDSSYRLIHGLANGAEYRQVSEDLFIDYITYKNFEMFLDHLLVVDAKRAEGLSELEAMLRERFERLGETVEGGKRYDQVHRLNLLRKL